MDRKYKGILAIDFDDTIAYSNFPKIKGLVTGSKKYINKLYNDGWYIIIWTCRCNDNNSEEPLTMAKQFLDDRGIKYHKINEHNPYLVKLFGNNCRKISADFYIDDKAIFGLPSWSKIYGKLSTLPKSFKSMLKLG
jgi:hypothetical protein